MTIFFGYANLTLPCEPKPKIGFTKNFIGRKIASSVDKDPKSQRGTVSERMPGRHKYQKGTTSTFFSQPKTLFTNLLEFEKVKKQQIARISFPTAIRVQGEIR